MLRPIYRRVRSLILTQLQTLWRDKAGNTSVEYGLLSALIVVAGIAAFTAIEPKLSPLLNGGGLAVLVQQQPDAEPSKQFCPAADPARVSAAVEPTCSRSPSL